MNSFNITGKVLETSLKETSLGKLQLIIVEDEKPFKNSNGEYDKDVFQINLWQALADNHYKKGDIISARGHMNSNNYEKDGNQYYKQELVVEKISLIS